MATKKNKLSVERMDGVERALYNMGYSFNKDVEIIGFNSVKFAKHLVENEHMIYTENLMFYEYQDGVWYVVSYEELGAHIFNVMENVKSGIYESRHEVEIVKVLKRLLFNHEKLNSNRHLINLENGMYNTLTHELIDHDPEYYSAIQLPYEYDEDAKCPRFEQFLDEVFEGDKERMQKTIEWFGYCLTAETKAQKSLLVYGSGGNGKG